MRTRNRQVIAIVVGALLLAALACNAEETPTGIPSGQQPPPADTSGTALPPVSTDTPVPDVTAESGCTLNAGWVADVTVPDNTEFPPGTAFIKTWRVRNTGTCDWEAGTQLVYISNDPLGGPAAVSIPPVAPNTNIDVSVNFVAPTTPGTHRSTWQMQSPEGVRYGSQIYVQIVVPAPVTDTPVPTPEPTAAPTTPPTATPFGGGTGRIVFVSMRDGNAELYIMQGNDAAPTRLTNNSEIDDWPDWSTDRQRIAFSRYTGGKPDVYAMQANGTSQVNLTNNPAWDSNPDWAPNGARIAFDSDRVGGVLQIWVMNSDGTGATQLTNAPQLSSSPSWSPDGNRIAFETSRDGQREIYVMNADGTGQTRLTFTGNNYGPQWSPNGQRIVFSSSNGLWVMNSDGTGLSQVTVNGGALMFDVHPQWSPDGRMILFDTTRSGNADLFVVNPDGTGLQQLTTNTTFDANAAWEPH